MTSLTFIVFCVTILSFKIFLNFILFVELFWMMFYTSCLSAASYSENGVIVLFSFLVLYIAAVELAFTSVIILGKLK